MQRIRKPNEKNKRNTMKFYRTLYPFQVISFDLDDTLYDNSQVMIKAESEFLAFLRQYDGVQDVTHAEWVFWKETIGRENPLLQENVTAWRTQSLQALLAKRQKSAVDISAISEQAMLYFLHWRHILFLLAELSTFPNMPRGMLFFLQYFSGCCEQKDRRAHV